MFDVAVIGAGVMGSATARALARRGRSVVLFERFEIGHLHGSSHGSSRIFRFSYPDETFVRMAQEALLLWFDLEKEIGEELLVATGGLDIGTLAVENEAALRACGAAVERLTPDELQDRFHYIHPPAAEVPIVYSPDTGFVRAEQAWKAFAASAVKHGAELRENTVVKAVEPRRGKVAIRTEAGDVRAGTAVVTAGAWARPLLAEAGIDLEVRPTRETIAYFHLPHERPPAIVEWGDPTIYALAAPGHGLKIGQHIAGPEADPDEEGSPDRESVKVLMDWVLHRFPSAAHAPHLLETCFYTNTSDEHFVLERHGNVVVGSPCSGHGFKFAPLIGERLADLVQD